MNPIRKIFIYIIFALSCLFPKKEKQFVYIGWHKTSEGEVFADNTKYLFLYASSLAGDTKHIWIAKSKSMAQELRQNGLISYYEKSFQGVWSMLKAKYFVLDAFLQPYHFMFSGRSKIIQLLHGKGMKKKGYGEPQLKKQDYIFGTSQFVYDTLSELFKRRSRYFITGYPRNDVLFKKISKSEISVPKKPKEKINESIKRGMKVVFYVPTFRRGKKVYDLSNEIDLPRLERFAKEKKVLFVFNLHNKYRAHTEEYFGENIMLLPESDIYPLINLCDLMVTDYSSIFVDYLLLNRPIVFYPYDFDEYSKKEGIVADYDSITPGPKVFAFDELLKRIDEMIFGNGDDVWEKERERVTKLYHTYVDGNSSKRIWDIIDRELK